MDALLRYLHPRLPILLDTNWHYIYIITNLWDCSIWRKLGEIHHWQWCCSLLNILRFTEIYPSHFRSIFLAEVLHSSIRDLRKFWIKYQLPTLTEYSGYSEFFVIASSMIRFILIINMFSTSQFLKIAWRLRLFLILFPIS